MGSDISDHFSEFLAGIEGMVAVLSESSRWRAVNVIIAQTLALEA